MKRQIFDNDIYSIIEPIIAPSGYKIVSLNCNSSKGALKIDLVVFHADGITLDCLVALHKLLLPRLQVYKAGFEVLIDIMSPGVSRVIKSSHEFEIFISKEVKIFSSMSSEWLTGTIEAVSDNSVTICSSVESSKQKIEILYDDILKAKLV